MVKGGTLGLDARLHWGILVVDNSNPLGEQRGEGPVGSPNWAAREEFDGYVDES